MHIYLFQRDLRIHDQPLLLQALKSGPTIGLFVFDPKDLGDTSYGFLKRGHYQRLFIYESLVDLKQSLSELNIPLLVTIGHLDDIIHTLKTNYPIESIYYETLLGSEESKRYAQLNALGIPLVTDTFKSLYHTDDLPYDVSKIPETFTYFRKRLEKEGSIRKTSSPLLKQHPIDQSLPSWWVTKEDLNIKDIVSTYKGGEQEGLKRVQYYFFDTKKVGGYKFTRNGMLKKDDSTKFSPYLAWGNLSPRYIYEQLKRYEQIHGANISTYWVYFELMWRDYFHFIHLKHGNQIFYKCGLANQCHTKHQQEIVQHWMNGKTGFPLVDANMKELALTGFMSNRGRQNVANLFTKQLQQDWRIGAAYFESLLIDFDVSSNTLNWLYNAGLGNDPRENRIFNVTTQGKRYDEKGHYVKHFLPELMFVPDHRIYDIPYFSKNERDAYGIDDYPHPIISPRGKR